MLDQERLDAIEVVKRQPDEDLPYYDVLGGPGVRHEVKIHDLGFVALLDVMPRWVPVGSHADYAVVQAARVSYGAGTKKVSADEALIHYLMENAHTSPFEMVEFKFHWKLPLFLARQVIRHRTANVNEESGRYSQMVDEFYRPLAQEMRRQTKLLRQGGEGSVDDETARDFLSLLDQAEGLYPQYEALLERELTRELARIALPTSIYTQWYWKIDLHNLLHFLRLRMDSHAQKEVQDYAWAIYKIIQPIVPASMEAFRAYRLESMTFNAYELEAMKTGTFPRTSKRARKNFESKMAFFEGFEFDGFKFNTDTE